MEKLTEYLDFATALAHEAGKITLELFRRGVAVERKADASPVTIADRATEQFIRERIAATYPDHGVLGEEFGALNEGARLRWIVDPIDGTQAFIHGVPLYTVLLALECDGDSVLGVIRNPALQETVAAATGLGCRYNGEPCRVSAVDDLAQARVHTTDYAELMRRNPRFCAELLRRAPFCRSWADAHGYLLVATGRAEVMLDPVMNLWDAAALKPIIEEAGGRFSDLAGKPSIHSGHTLATNGLLHEQILELARLDG